MVLGRFAKNPDLYTLWKLWTISDLNRSICWSTAANAHAEASQILQNAAQCLLSQGRANEARKLCERYLEDHSGTILGRIIRGGLDLFFWYQKSSNCGASGKGKP